MNNVGMDNKSPIIGFDGNTAAPFDPQRRELFHTYIYDYFLRSGMLDCARAILNSYPAPKVRYFIDNTIDANSKNSIDGKHPDDLPAPSLPNATGNCFLHEWFCSFHDTMNAQNESQANAQDQQLVGHTQRDPSDDGNLQRPASLKPTGSAPSLYQRARSDTGYFTLNQSGRLPDRRFPRQGIPAQQNPSSTNGPAKQLLQDYTSQLERLEMENRKKLGRARTQDSQGQQVSQQRAMPPPAAPTAAAIRNSNQIRASE